MLKEADLLTIYWREVVHTILYTLNKVLYQRKYGKTSYELWHVRALKVKYFKIFGNKYYIHND